MKKKWEGQFFSQKKSKNTVRCIIQPTQKFFGNFFFSIGRVKNSTCTGQVFIDFHYHTDLEWFLQRIKKFTFLPKVNILRRWSFFINYII